MKMKESIEGQLLDDNFEYGEYEKFLRDGK